jgi:hypothetical protein
MEIPIGRAVGIAVDIRHPVGTLEEVVAEGLDPGVVETCAAQNNASDILGCPHWGACRMPYKGESGPRNHVVLVMNVSGSYNQDQMGCYHYVRTKPSFSTPGEAFEIVGNEGDSYVTHGSKMVPGPSGTLKDGSMERTRTERICEPFPRPFQNPELREAMARIKLLNRISMRDEQESRQRALAAMQEVHAMRGLAFASGQAPESLPSLMPPVARPPSKETPNVTGTSGTSVTFPEGLRAGAGVGPRARRNTPRQAGEAGSTGSVRDEGVPGKA